MDANLIGQFLPPEMDDKQRQFAGMAIKKGMDEYKQDDKGTMWLCGIPIQTGPGSAYSRNLTNWMHTILVVQVLACAMKIIILNEFIGSLWMILVIAVGYYAMIHDMNITILCLWGILCLLNGVFSIIGLILPMIVGMVKFQVLKMIAAIAAPLSYFLGAIFAVHLYHVSADEADVGTRLLPAKADQFGAMFDNTDPYNPRDLKRAGGEMSEKALAAYKAAQQVKDAENTALNGGKKQVCYGVC